MSAIKLTIMNGAGNSFYIINLLEKGLQKAFDLHFGGDNHAEIARSLCKDEGVDGVVFLLPAAPDSSSDFSWDFYNSDGSSAEMCGNAARCVAKYAVMNGISKEDLRFDTLAGVISANASKESYDVDIQMTGTSDERWDRELKTKNFTLTYCFVNTGVPHIVIATQDIDDLERLKRISLEIRQTNEFSDSDANITFFQIENEGEIRSITYERGVEDFTQACGTGAVAAARIFCGPSSCSGVSHVKVKVPGGDLTVQFDSSQPHLLGPTEFVSETYLFPKRRS